MERRSPLRRRGAGSGQTLIVGNDEKQGWDENLKPTFNEPGHETLSLIGISKPETPRVAATLR